MVQIKPKYIIGLFTLGILSIIAIEKADYWNKYNQAKDIATTIYGDKREPLDEREKIEWYKDMKVPWRKSPSKIRLEVYSIERRR